MSPRTGRPRSNAPKNIQLKIRADEKTIANLDFCCEKLNLTRSDVIRLGIQRIKESLGNEK